MKLSSAKAYLKFSRSQRTGLFALFFLIIVFQTVYFFFDFDFKSDKLDADKTQWLSVALPADSVPPKKEVKIYPFNPNFITDFKGYTLGMSVAEIDRLLAFRKTNRYVNSAEEFQTVTQVSDSLLAVIAPYFKFPDWVKNRKKYPLRANHHFEKPQTKLQIDINLATREELKKIYGIGDGLSDRILKEKEKFGGFVSMAQMNDIWGLSPEVVENLNKGFKVGALPEIKKVNVNDATIKELAAFPYFRYHLAKAIVTYRSMNNGIKGTEDLLKISSFPSDKIDIIAVYLEF